jgi:hypothetical protein
LLAQQFGSSYSDHPDFKKKAKAALKKIQIVCPGLKLAEATGGLIILPTSPPRCLSNHAPRSYRAGKLNSFE